MAIYLLLISYLCLLISVVFVLAYTRKGKKVTLDIESVKVLREMLKSEGADQKILEDRIIEDKKYYYHPLKNHISLRGFDNTSAYDIVSGLHEGGHYLSVNRSVGFHKWFSVSQTLIAINRLLVIPIFIFSMYSKYAGKEYFFLDTTVLTIALIYFLIASLLRIRFGLAEEYYASMIAMGYLKKNFKSSVVKYARQFYIAAFMSQLLFTFLIVVAVPIIYWMMVFA